MATMAVATGTYPAPYIHGTAPEEQDRLSTLNKIMNAASMNEMRLQGFERVLDIGCGLGQLARQIARQVMPFGEVVAIEQSAEQLATARRKALCAGDGDLVDFRQGDATNLPLSAHELGSFDIAHCRFVLEHVAHPQAVVRQMVSAVRPGGRIILMEPDHALLSMSCAPVEWPELWSAYTRAYVCGDPFIGRRLPELIARAGARVTRTTMVPYAAASGASDFREVAGNFIHMIECTRDRLISRGLITASSFDNAITALRRWMRTPGAAFWMPMIWVEAVR